MKNFFYYATIVLSFVIILVGHFHYQQKLEVQAETLHMSESIIEVEVPTEKAKARPDVDWELGGILEELTKEHEDEKELSITVLGSSSLSSISYSNTWPKLLVQDLRPVLDDHQLNLTVIDVHQSTSDSVVNGSYMETLLKSEPDLLLIDPFSHNDFDNLSMKESIENLNELIDKLEKELDAQIIFLSPSPLLSEEKFAEHVKKLKKELEDQDYLYADHWKAWPKSDDDDIKTYVKDDMPTKKGHELIAESLRGYLLK
ncbi:SGNH/GDSL hydrolase family protein [Halalkalibacter krulwichiae]|uniref:SGNH hydrolase-type esterase domain-containing protein n=1 Tax=Halalkalibacter krulwichiae TaxID=199441 RepID=A0A1X9MMA7_9BACI|nr:SGNH/GDSL hydrolase family protein [Halalkalibacter krulwichiae]ARK32242.1 hypothetical protein BkAM31D_21615 [Halalkalibacter krulwichiae]